jgi:hypothetical protein
MQRLPHSAETGCEYVTLVRVCEDAVECQALVDTAVGLRVPLMLTEAFWEMSAYTAGYIEIHLTGVDLTGRGLIRLSRVCSNWKVFVTC